MSVVSYLHTRYRKGKVILNAILLLCSTLVVLYTIVGNVGCKNVDKVSDTLIFRYNEDQTVSTLDPAYVKSQSELWICTQLFNGLVDLDSNLKPAPMLAKSWEIAANGLVYKFKLRTDVQFHRQGKYGFEHTRWVTAHDVVYSFKRLLDPATASPGAWIFSDKVNGSSLFDKTQKVADSMLPFYAANDSTFVLRLNKPFSAMLSLLGTAWCSVVPKEKAENKAEFGRNPVGTGPFYMKLWEEEVKMVLRKNPDYFESVQGKKLPFLEAINVDFLKNKQTAFMRFVAGEYDFFNGVEPSFKDELVDSKGNLKAKYRNKFHFISRPFLNTEYLGLWLDSVEGNAKNPLQNKYLRQALNYAVDRKELVRYFRNNLGIPGTGGFVPPELGSGEKYGFHYDPDAAKKALELAGYTNGKGCPELSITTTSDYLDMVVYVKKYWEAMGLKVKIDVQTGGMIRQLRNKGKLPVWRGSWIADYADAENYLACFYSKNFSPEGPNYTHYASKEFDRTYEQLLVETRAEKRIEHIANAEKILMQDAPVVVLFYDKSIRLFHNNIQYFGNDATNRLVLKYTKKTANKK